jgi:hypothetical protein
LRQTIALLTFHCWEDRPPAWLAVIEPATNVSIQNDAFDVRVNIE